MEATINKHKEGKTDLHKDLLNSLQNRLARISHIIDDFYHRKQPQSIVQFLQDWLKKLIKDGYYLEKFLEILKQNIQDSNRQWVQRFLSSCRTTLRKRNLRPRVCLPRMFVHKEENQVKKMLKQKFSVLAANEPILEYVMKTNYKWEKLNYTSIAEELRANRYEVYMLHETQQTDTWDLCYEGIAWRSEKMKEIEKAYRDCLYLFQYCAPIFRNGDKTVCKYRKIAFGCVLTQFALPLVVQLCLYDIDCIQIALQQAHSFENELKQQGEAQEKQNVGKQMTQTKQNQTFQFIPEGIDPRKLLDSFLNWIEHKNSCVIHYQYSEQQFKNQKRFAYITDIQRSILSEQKPIQIVKVLISKNPKTNILSQKMPKLFMGLFGPSCTSPYSTIYDTFNKAITNNNQWPIPAILRQIKDPCHLITILLKISDCLLGESRTKRQPALETVWHSSLRNQWIDMQIKKLITTLYAKPVLKTILSIFRESQMYSVTQKVDRNSNKFQCILKANKGKQKEKEVLVDYDIPTQCWKCECGYQYSAGLPCPHIVALLQRYSGQIQYYVNERWKSRIPLSTKKKEIKSKRGCPSTNNKGLLRLINLYRSTYYGYIL